MTAKSTKLTVSEIGRRIHNIRGHRVMLDSDLAELYGVETKALTRAMKRNAGRFPEDFVFQLDKEEYANLRYQIGASKKWGGRRYMPYVFTEHGAIMLASVLNSERAIETSIFVVRAFVRMREILTVHKELARKVSELERRVTGHDEDIKTLVAAIRQLMQPPSPKKRRIGYKHGNK